VPEVLKLLWDMIVLRDQARKHQVTLSIWVFAVSFLLVLCLIVFPLLLFYAQHPSRKLPLAVGVLVVALDYAALVWFEVRRRRNVKCEPTGKSK
jgi:hypothetical protein